VAICGRIAEQSMSIQGMSVAVSLAGSVMLLVGAGRVSRARQEDLPGSWQRWCSVGGLALLFVGLWIRVVSLAPAVGACPASTAPAASSAAAAQAAVPAHCFHGAPWPPIGSSR